MKISDRLSSRDVDKKGKQESLSRSDVSGSPFVRTLTRNRSEFENHEQELQILKDELDKVGNELEREPTIANFRTFRDLIGRITKNVTSHAYRLQRVGGTTLNPRCFEIITVIDREADNLYRLIMTENKDRLAITNKILELKGLVVDLKI
ncbi:MULTISPECIES: YaaR family protein [Geobacter]|uniref:YaaR family protein n=1 Tax=Geobacter TaxID=28231 RepID=UPI002572BD64|nr:YaaR family protein [Geobacter sulfurreducens]BEH10339.1 YaaR family protein [Geobacter sulfurreducens subsp. ethanolicus]BET58073.1 YaaR family protein [Geobacter sp. 60473]